MYYLSVYSLLLLQKDNRKAILEGETGLEIPRAPKIKTDACVCVFFF